MKMPSWHTNTVKSLLQDPSIRLCILSYSYFSNSMDKLLMFMDCMRWFRCQCSALTSFTNMALAHSWWHYRWRIIRMETTMQFSNRQFFWKIRGRKIRNMSLTGSILMSPAKRSVSTVSATNLPVMKIGLQNAEINKKIWCTSSTPPTQKTSFLSNSTCSNVQFRESLKWMQMRLPSKPYTAAS